MKRTRAEFVARWKYHLTGFALYGHATGKIENILERATRVHDLPAEVEKMLGQLWDDLKPEDKPLPVQPTKETRK